MSDYLLRSHMQRTLERLVAGLTAYVMDFNGPATAHVGGTLYVTLCSSGVKPEGDAAESYPTWEEAVERYHGQLAEMIAANKDRQLAWRRLPALEHSADEGYRVTSRLAFI